MSASTVTPNQQTLAQRIRTKFPGTYDDMDDNMLEQKVLAKHPEYSDLPRTNAPTPLQYDAQGNPIRHYQVPGNDAHVIAKPPFLSGKGMKMAFYNAVDTGSNALPGAGATAGGLIGAGVGTPADVVSGPLGTAAGAVGGAGMGGMAGEAAKRYIRQGVMGWDKPESAGTNAMGIAKEGAIQGATQAGAEALPFIAPLLKNSSVGQYSRALAPTTKINKAITQEITPELIQRGEFGTLQGLEKKATQKISELSPELNQGYQDLQAASPKLPTRAATGRMVKGTEGQIPNSGKQVVSDLENLKQQYIVGGKVVQPQAVQAIEGVQDIMKQYGPNVSPTNLRRIRQIFEDPVAQRGAYSGADISTSYALNAQKHAADSIRGILNKTPDIGALNKEISFWLDVQRVTSQSGLRQTGQQGGLMKVLTPLGSGLAASTTGISLGAEKGLEAGAATALTAMAYQVVRSPGWRTASAVAKDRFANALARGSIGDATALAARFGVALAEAPPPQQQEAPVRLPWQNQAQ